MNLSILKLTNFCRNIFIIHFLVLSVINLSIFQGIGNLQAIQQSDLIYEDQIELKYGIPTQLSEASVPSSATFDVWGITDIYLSANYSYNNGSIWIDDQNEKGIWEHDLNEAFEVDMNLNDSSMRYYSLWANSSTLGNNTLYYTFIPRIFHEGNVGLIIIIITVFMMPILIIVLIAREKGRKKDSHSVRVAKKIGERIALRFEDKYQEKVKSISEQKFKKREKKLCPKCGFEIKVKDDNFCTECGFKLRR